MVALFISLADQQLWFDDCFDGGISDNFSAGDSTVIYQIIRTLILTDVPQVCDSDGEIILYKLFFWTCQSLVGPQFCDIAASSAVYQIVRAATLTGFCDGIRLCVPRPVVDYWQYLIFVIQQHPV